MSSDNGIAVLRTVYTGDEGTSSYEYRVAHYFASGLESDQEVYELFSGRQVYLSREEALVAAHDLDKVSHTEYNVVEWDMDKTFDDLREVPT